MKAESMSQPSPSPSRLADESGVALIVALAALMIISLLAAASVTLAVNTTQGTRRNMDQRQAFEAAQAGLQVALYRYNMLAPSAGDCVGDGVSAPSSAGVCTSSVATLGDGASYQYETTPQLASSGTCVGSMVTNVVGVSNVCLSATGMSHGVSVRSEMRVAAFAGTPLFPYPGLIGLQSIVHNGSYTSNYTEASNGTILVNGSFVPLPGYQVYLGPSGSYNGPATPTRLNGPIVLSPVNPGSSATTNDNSAFVATTNGNGSVSYTATGRAFSATGPATVTFTGGIYNYCSFNVSGNVVLNVAPSASVAIYIDSPSDPGSGCPQGSGSFGLGGASGKEPIWSNPSQNPTALQLYVYAPNTITFNGSSTFNGTLYAPTSNVTFNGSASFTGGLSANDITVNGSSTYTWNPQVASLQVSTQGVYYRSAWGRCSVQPPSGSPMGGCG
ncbi:pilus assembly PilX N-terminal domain-containing protein [Conexibacter sp. DBS9H8]|uniref:pilus assembly PilX family protein n=1 Tax=Conexibacter sp. DBS9H8 TaxID=2937801 RepID=UPI00201085CC|nr:pilus assembly PilX N-terminal domain-containing protein [Conexibacter sp. DBS9H8]